ncbi:hypothetical protein HZC30_04140 [Candidatus Woesearchaeota archaeon]|nr:hypothetical protein [Candidatus Woesearchaeota archaeon]
MGRKRNYTSRRSWAGLDPEDYGISAEVYGDISDAEFFSPEGYQRVLRVILNRDQYRSGTREIYTDGEHRGRTVDDVLMEDAGLTPKKYQKKD